MGIALCDGAFRIASQVADRGIERVVCAAVVGAAVAVSVELGCGLVGLGGQPLAIAGVTTGVWLGTRRLPAPKLSVAAEFVRGWQDVSGTECAMVGWFGGVVLAWMVWNLHAPLVSIDSTYYHLPEVIAWVQGGHPGSQISTNYLFPVGSYPLANEVLLAWGAGISHSFVGNALWAPAALALAAVAGWLGLRSLQVPRWGRVLTVSALCSTPIILALQVDGAENDVPAMAWLMAGGSLALTSRRQPGLAVPAVVGIGLAVGTKTTELPLGLALTAWLVHRHRRELRSRRLSVVLGSCVAALVGASWYVRDLLQHGSPFWPFAATPWGDRLPIVLRSYHSLLMRPRATLQGHLRGYATFLGGATVLLMGAPAAALATRRRRNLLAAAGVICAVVLWAAAPTTGVSDVSRYSAQVSQSRYLFGALVLAAAILGALVSSRSRALAVIILAAALIWNLLQDATGAFPATPWRALLVGAILGSVLLTVTRLPTVMALSADAVRLAAAPMVVGLILAASAALTLGASGYVERAVARDRTFDHYLLAWFAAQPRFERDNRPIAMTSLLSGSLSGDRLQHPIELIAARESCAKVARRRIRGWVVLQDDQVLQSLIGFSSGRCLTNAAYSRVHGYRIYAPLP